MSSNDHTEHIVLFCYLVILKTYLMQQQFFFDPTQQQQNKTMWYHIYTR